MKEIFTYNYRHPWLLELLVGHLSAHINAREPTAVTRVTVVPTHTILKTTNLRGKKYRSVKFKGQPPPIKDGSQGPSVSERFYCII